MFFKMKGVVRFVLIPGWMTSQKIQNTKNTIIQYGGCQTSSASVMQKNFIIIIIYQPKDVHIRIIDFHEPEPIDPPQKYNLPDCTRKRVMFLKRSTKDSRFFSVYFFHISNVENRTHFPNKYCFRISTACTDLCSHQFRTTKTGAIFACRVRHVGRLLTKWHAGRLASKLFFNQLFIERTPKIALKQNRANIC